MHLLELIVPFAIRASLIQIRKNILVVTSIANGQRTTAVGASIEHGAIADPTGCCLRTGFPSAHFACEFCVGMRIVTIRMSRNKGRGEAER
jgi:hypothetical protein